MRKAGLQTERQQIPYDDDSFKVLKVSDTVSETVRVCEEERCRPTFDEVVRLRSCFMRKEKLKSGERLRCLYFPWKMSQSRDRR